MLSPFLGQKPILIIIGLLILGIGVASFCFAENPYLILLVQILSGSWSPPSDFNQIDKLAFSISAVVAIIINWGTLIAAFVLVYGYFSRLLLKEVEMAKVKQILDLEDEVTKAALLTRLGVNDDNKKKINEAFEEAAMKRAEIVEKTFGAKAASKFKELLDVKL